MSAATYQAIITAIDSAIQAWAEDGNLESSVSVAGKSYSRTDLKELLELRNNYQKLLNAASGGVGFQVRKFRSGGATVTD